MRSIKYILFLSVGFYTFLHNDIPSKFPEQTGVTRGALLANKANEAAKVARNLDFLCDGYEWPTGYKLFCDSFDIVLRWGERDNFNVKDNRLAQARIDTIWMFVPPCNKYTLPIFFHEVGHALLEHEHTSLEFNDRQDEADYFSEEVMRLLFE